MDDDNDIIMIADDLTTLSPGITVTLADTEPSNFFSRKFEELLQISDISYEERYDRLSNLNLKSIERQIPKDPLREKEPTSKKHYDEYIGMTMNHPYNLDSQTDLISMRNALMTEED